MLALLVGACGDASSEPAPAGSITADAVLDRGAPTADGARTVHPGDSAAPPPAAAAPATTPTGDAHAPAVFEDRTAVPGLGAWYQALRERYRPSADGWWTEVVAEAVGATLREGIELAIEGAGGLGAAPGRSFEGASRLRPTELETAREDGLLRVVRGRLPGERLAAEHFASSVEELVAPFRGAAECRVVVDVLGVLPLPERRFELRTRLRISGLAGAGGRQLTTGWRSVWELGAQGRRMLLVRLEAEDFEEVELRRRPLVELTAALLEGEPFYRDGLFVGAPECMRRVDKGIGFAEVFLGMHGMGVGDLDGDGIEDLYVAERGGTPNRLLVLGPDGRLHDRATELGLDFLDDCSGVLIADLDGDGRRDLVLGRGRHVAVVFAGERGFERPLLLDCGGSEAVYSISAADPDGDRDLDLYATRYVKGGVAGGVPAPYHDARNGARNVYWRNDGGRSFRDATSEVGLDAGNDRFSLASIWEDLDGDGDLDLYVTNDFGRNNLYRNDGGSFVDVAEELGALDLAAGMGVSVADVDLDGDLDLYVSNMFSAAGARITTQPRFMPRAGVELRADYERHTRGNTLLLAGERGLTDGSAAAGCSPGGWAWGAMFTDFDADGLPDLVVPNGFVTTTGERDLESFFWRVVVGASPPAAPATAEYERAWVGISTMSQNEGPMGEGMSWNGRERNYAYWNLGAGRFADVSGAAGLDHLDDGRVACIVDLDGDGRLDLWLRSRTAPILRFLHNRAQPSGAWLALELVGVECNPDAIGALALVEAGGRELRRRIYAGEGYLGCSSRILHFGLGEARGPARVRVRWPDGTEEPPLELEPGARYRIVQGSGRAERVEPQRADLGALREERLPTRVGAPRSRVPLLDPLPLKALELPHFEGAARLVAEHAGRPLLVPLWASERPEAAGELRALASRWPELAATGLALHPLALDGVREAAAARAAAASLALPFEGGRLDRRGKLLFEVLALEILGTYKDLPLPVSLLLDAHGALRVLYLGSLDVDLLLADLAELAAERDAGVRWPTTLTGGRWMAEGPSRQLEPLIEVLSRGGYQGLVRELEEELARRRGGR